MPKIQKNKGLSDKERLFCYEYVRDLNKNKAAIRAGFSKKSAACQATQIYKKLQAQKLIQELQSRKIHKLEISAERTLQEVARLAYVDIRKAFDENGNLKNIQDIDDDTAAALAGIENEELFEGRGEDREHIGTLKKIKIHDKKGVLELLMKHLDLLNPESNPPPDPLAGRDIIILPPDGETVERIRELERLVHARLQATRASYTKKSTRKA